MLRSRTSILVLLISIFWIPAIAQDKESEYAYALDTTMNKWSPTGIRIGIDISGPIYNMFEPTTGWYAGSADIDFHKFFGVLEVGQGTFSSVDSTTSYSSKGIYYRLGIDANFIAKDPNLNVFFFGIRYAGTLFDEKMSGELPSSGWGSQYIDLTQNKSNTNWVELNIGMRVRLWKSLFAGYTARLKILKHNTYSEGNFQSYYIPGFGVAERNTGFGFNYYIQYRFEWKKKPIPWRNN